MNLILRKVKIIDPKSPFSNQIVDIKITNGFFESIGSNISSNSATHQEFLLEDLHVSQGWIDTSVSLGEPGFEERETIQHGLDVAAKSGFTGIFLQPNTFPKIDNQSQIQFVKQKAIHSSTELFPIGSFTKNGDGIEMAELFDMNNAGAIAFGDYNKNCENSNLLKIGLQYVQNFDGHLITYCQDESLKGTGVVNEGIVSTKIGLKGIPNLAEEIAVARNLSILEYTGGKLHIPTISTKESVELIRNAKQKGLNVTCSASVHHLVLTDEQLIDFDSRFKIMPPLRKEEDRIALIEALLDDTIDCITSDHNPIDIEHKKIEFDLAKSGTVGLESAFGALMNILPLEKIVQKFTQAKSIFGIESSVINLNSKVSISLFTTKNEWVFEKENILSKSKNSAFLGKKMIGKAIGIYNQGKFIINE